MATQLEELVNSASGTINGAVTDSATSCTITNGSLLDAGGDFRLAVWDSAYGDSALAKAASALEYVKVVAHSGNTISSMTRGIETGFAGIAWGDGWNWACVGPTKGQWDALDTKLNTALTPASNWINVQDVTYGATGDGVDTTTAVHDAITAATGTDLETTTVYFPPGEYNLANWPTAGRDYAKRLHLYGPSATITGTTSLTFLQATDEMKVEGIRFKNWDVVFDFEPLSTTKDEFQYDRLTFEGCEDAFMGITPTVGGLISRLSISNCVAKDLARHFVEMRVPFDSFSCINSEVDGCYNQAIRLGHNTVGEEDNWKEARVEACNFKGIQSKNGTNSTAGIIMYGRHLKAIGNHIEDVTCGTSGANESWGIYTKCRRATLIGNTIKDIKMGAGSTHATGIRIKGDDRGSNGTPKGYNVVCTGNNIFMDGSATTHGINISQDNVLVSGNLIDNFDTYGIEVDNDTLANINITNNGIRGTDTITTGSWGIRLRQNGQGCVVTGNDVEKVDYGIRLQPQSGGTASGVIISQNIVSAEAGNFVFGQAGQGTIASLQVTDNFLDGEDATSKGFEINGTAITELLIYGNQFTSNIDVQFDVNTEPTLAKTFPIMDVSGDLVDAETTFLSTTSGVLTATTNITTPKTSSTLATDAFTYASDWHELTAESASADDLVTINGSVAGKSLMLTAVSGEVITVRSTGNINLNTAGDFIMTGANGDFLELFYNGSAWLEKTRSLN
jgi:hypothetical protein